jgi:GDPmannose 4,6-dehydratase
MEVAIVTGASGQDGSYLCELLTEKGYHLHRFVGDVTSYQNVLENIQGFRDHEKIEIYNLAAKVHDNSPYDTLHVNTTGILNIMEAVKNLGLQSKCRIFQASSSEIFANHWESPQTEFTHRAPRNVYGISKVTADSLVDNYRRNHDLYVSSGILYNHESPRRKDIYVTQKIVKGLQSGECFKIGNIECRRDWGHAKDYVNAMWLILQQDTSDSYIIATGKTHSVREFIEMVVDKMNKTITWLGEGKNKVGIIDDKIAIKVSEEFYRPEHTILVGNPSKLENIGWSRSYDLESIIEEMLFPH